MGVPATNPVASSPVRSRRWRWWSLGAALLLAGGIVWWPWEGGSQLARDAEALLATDPVRAERLAAQAVDAGSRMGWLIRARALLQLQQPLEAAGCWGLVKSPEQLPADAVLAFVEDAQKVGEFRLAELGLRAATKNRPASLRSLKAELALYAQILKLAELQQLQQRVEQLPQSDAAIWQQLAQLYLQHGQPLLQRQAYESALQRSLPDGDASTIRRDLVQLLLSLGEYTAAQAFVAENFQGHPTAEDRIQQAQLWQVEGQAQQALEELNLVLRDNPQQAAALLLRGTLLTETQRWEEARADLSQHVTVQPHDPEGHYRLGLLLNQLGEKEAATKHLQRQAELAQAQRDALDAQQALGRKPGDPQLMRNLARHYRMLGQTTAAERWEAAAARVTESLPPNRRP